LNVLSMLSRWMRFKKRTMADVGGFAGASL
jgi:hypothetical protein